MKAISFQDANKVFVSEEMADLPAYSDGKLFITKWRASLRERLSLLLFGTVWVCLLGEVQPPIALVGAKGAHFHYPVGFINAMLKEEKDA